ncbi:hypothetical protein [Lactobacillus allii] [Lactiplantibacillus mudanjiangensis]|uniref:neutral/alkaline non-lysosomal ceramidase N-terminal domain-containing protein n=1 Tax=Lactiplantibacillus mudanjiangensis TaxID=1296538 RepID=UPI0010155ACC|nr:neutral/alkaline non-lysosomal ceramidase N-terminal domain-containing protein [Lactiplantibacillus mudanjiangensis]VDG21385.1 hypothetical protein [Lactobacillus allii] [Lactiplantibacillus mudanjiangensis]VDG31612.1 hypothetical protein [Lactobacillus allii] [Lactiplantibacillus mudanjiangensis]
MEYGFGMAKITPTVGVQMEGYQSRYAQSIHDDLYVAASVIKHASTTVVLISMDIVVVPGFRADRIKRRLSEIYQLPASQIIISANHTHSGPVVSDLLLDNAEVSETYWQLITQQALQAVAQAMTMLQGVTAVLTKSPVADKVYGNRNNPMFAYNNQLVEVRFLHANQLYGSIFLLASHPTVLNAQNLAISGDLISQLRRDYQQTFGITPFIALTDCGDTSTRYTRQASTFAEVERLAKLIVKSVRKPVLELPICFNNFSLKQISYECAYDPMTNPQATALYHHLTSRYEQAVGSDKEKYAGFVSTYTHIRYLGHTHFQTKAFIWDFDDLRVITYPGELVYALGQRLRNIDSKPTLLITLANDYRGYSVDEKKFGQYFESSNSVFLKGMADEFVNRIIAGVTTK